MKNELSHGLIKAELRSSYKRLKSKLPADQKKDLDAKIVSALLSLEIYKRSKVILAYMANNLEIDIDPIVERSIALKKRVAIPKCYDKIAGFGSNAMDFYYIRALNEVSLGSFNIREPRSLSGQFELKEMQTTEVMMILPGLVYDRRGNRLGYGRGYYDRYLSQPWAKKITKVGVIYDFALIERLDNQESDIPVDFLVTEKEIIRVSPNEITD